jgi:hypothetical protein
MDASILSKQTVSFVLHMHMQPAHQTSIQGQGSHLDDGSNNLPSNVKGIDGLYRPKDGVGLSDCAQRHMEGCKSIYF